MHDEYQKKLNALVEERRRIHAEWHAAKWPKRADQPISDEMLKAQREIWMKLEGDLAEIESMIVAHRRGRKWRFIAPLEKIAPL